MYTQAPFVAPIGADLPFLFSSIVIMQVGAGHSMGGGLAAVAAGSHPTDVATAFLMDPVDWNFESNRNDSQYLTRQDH